MILIQHKTKCFVGIFSKIRFVYFGLAFDPENVSSTTLRAVEAAQNHQRNQWKIYKNQYTKTSITQVCNGIN